MLQLSSIVLTYSFLHKKAFQIVQVGPNGRLWNYSEDNITKQKWQRREGYQLNNQKLIK